MLVRFKDLQGSKHFGSLRRISFSPEKQARLFLLKSGKGRLAEAPLGTGMFCLLLSLWSPTGPRHSGHPQPLVGGGIFHAVNAGAKKHHEGSTCLRRNRGFTTNAAVLVSRVKLCLSGIISLNG